MTTRIKLSEKEIELVHSKGLEGIRKAAYHFVRTRIAPSSPAKNARQTPKSGNPVFKAQHATGTDSRDNIEKNFGMAKGRALSENEIDSIVGVIMGWIREEVEKSGKKQARIDEF